MVVSVEVTLVGERSAARNDGLSGYKSALVAYSIADIAKKKRAFVTN